jgi:uncharacterized membrane protein YsdA (DUF1294 family)
MVQPYRIYGSVNQDPKKASGWLRIAFWISIAISVAVVARRLVALASPSGNAPPQLAQLDNGFASHATLTLAHIIPAMLFVLVAPFIVFHRQGRMVVIERAFYGLGAIVGVTAYAMSTHAVGGWIERSAVLFFNSLFLFSLTRAYIYRRTQEAAEERVWQLRSIAVLLGIATTRPVMGVFFATSRLTHLTPAQFFGIAFWIGWSINVLAFEIWIRSAGRRRPGEASGLLINPRTRSAS